MPKGSIIITPERCKGCSYCLAFCPKDCIELGGKTNSNGYFFAVFKNPKTCTGCAICAVMCPDFAIEVYR